MDNIEFAGLCGVYEWEFSHKLGIWNLWKDADKRNEITLTDEQIAEMTDREILHLLKTGLFL